MTPTRINFWEESPGVLSMVRLSAILQTVAGFFILMACIGVAIRGGGDAAGIIAALAAASASAFAGSWAALKQRAGADAQTPKPPPPAPAPTTQVTVETPDGSQQTTVTMEP